MRIKDIDGLLLNDTKVSVRKWTSQGFEELFLGHPFANGGFEADPNIKQWRALQEVEVDGIGTAYEEVKLASGEVCYVVPILVISVEVE